MENDDNEATSKEHLLPICSIILLETLGKEFKKLILNRIACEVAIWYKRQTRREVASLQRQPLATVPQSACC